MGIVIFRFWELQSPLSNFWISNLQIWILDLQIQIIKNIHLCKIAKVDTHWHIAPCYNGIVVVEAGSQKPCLRGWDTSPCVYLVPAQLAFIWFRSFRLWPQLTISLAGAMERGRAIGVVTGHWCSQWCSHWSLYLWGSNTLCEMSLYRRYRWLPRNT